jgi:Protein of unknown function (DUF402)
MRHETGATVVVQEIWKDAVWAARPMTVVQDEDDLVALWFPQGTRWKAPIPSPGWLREEERGARMVTCLERREWAFADSEWDVSTLVLMRPGDWHAVWVSWLDGNQHWGWYVNLQEPFRRTDKGYETMDLALDVVVELDRTWRWKDEGELDLFVERGVFGEALATRVRDEGLRVAQSAERNEWPFDAPWPDWRPDRSWGVPQLPEGWSERCR